MMKSQNSVLLDVKNVSLEFGGTRALINVSMEIKQCEILAIIGPNGAGKTSLLNCINGFYRPQAGDIMFLNRNLGRTAPHKIARLGIARTFQNIELYTGMNTLDNLMAARHFKMKRGAFMGSVFFGLARKEETEHREFVERIIDLLDLQPVRKKIVGSLPYGQRKRIDLARALCMEPKILLLDEPMAGMNVEEKEDIARFILDVFELRKISIVLVEHDMEVVMDISDRVVVLDFGIKISEGTPAQIIGDAKVIRAYLGMKRRH